MVVPVVIIVGEVGLAKTRRIAVALTRVGGRGSAEEVHFEVALDVPGRVDVARSFQSNAALLGIKAQLTLVV